MDPLDELKATKETLNPGVRARVLALGRDAVPALLAMLEDEELGAVDSPAEGWPPIHAVTLLADIGDPAAVEPMLDALLETEEDEILGNVLALRLPSFGSAVLEPALRRLGRAIDDDDLDAERQLVGVLAGSGARDERIYDAICDHFDADPVFGAMCFAEYGDERALAQLLGEMEDFEVEEDDRWWGPGFNELRDAYERLGGVLTGAILDKAEAIAEQWQIRRELEVLGVTGRPTAKAKVGRNDPCPCASGKKYKKWCLGK